MVKLGFKRCKTDLFDMKLILAALRSHFVRDKSTVLNAYTLSLVKVVTNPFYRKTCTIESRSTTLKSF